MSWALSTSWQFLEDSDVVPGNLEREMISHGFSGVTDALKHEKKKVPFTLTELKCNKQRTASNYQLNREQMQNR